MSVESRDTDSAPTSPNPSPDENLSGPEGCPLFVLRPAVASDRAFICNAWALCFTQPSFRSGRHLAILRRPMNAYIDVFFQDPRSTALVACDPEDQDVILGFAVYRADHLQFVYVKERVRRAGIATALLRQAFGDQSFAYGPFTSDPFRPLAERFGAVQVDSRSLSEVLYGRPLERPK